MFVLKRLANIGAICTRNPAGLFLTTLATEINTYNSSEMNVLLQILRYTDGWIRYKTTQARMEGLHHTFLPAKLI